MDLDNDLRNDLKNDLVYLFLYENIKDMVYKPFEDIDEETEFLFSKENIHVKENRDKLNKIVKDYNMKFQEIFEENYNFKLNYDDESLIIMDVFMPTIYKSKFFNDIDSMDILKENIEKWVNLLGSFFLFYIKKTTKQNPKITYPIYKSYFVKDGERIYPYSIAMQKISTDLSFDNYDFFGEIKSFIRDEDFKYDVDLIKDVKDKYRGLILRSYIKKR